MHFPELALVRGALGGFGRLGRLRVNAQREVYEHQPCLAAVNPLFVNLRLGLLKVLQTVRALEVRELDDQDWRVRVAPVMIPAVGQARARGVGRKGINACRQRGWRRRRQLAGLRLADGLLKDLERLRAGDKPGVDEEGRRSGDAALRAFGQGLVDLGAKLTGIEAGVERGRVQSQIGRILLESLRRVRLPSPRLLQGKQLVVHRPVLVLGAGTFRCFGRFFGLRVDAGQGKILEDMFDQAGLHILIFDEGRCL